MAVTLGSGSMDRQRASGTGCRCGKDISGFECPEEMSQPSIGSGTMPAKAAQLSNAALPQ
jgi:hypothetical protein